ncbi:MAG: hypothetical protein DME42_04630 [Verrucomicrobia bacterium]|nr:MAG: hypothetical protein DME42_04630 [Verrucomicrobiota bacterium]
MAGNIWIGPRRFCSRERSDLHPGSQLNKQLTGEKKEVPMYSVLLQFFRFNTSPAARLLRTGFLLLAFVCFTPHRALAVTPAPDGGYPNNNTAEGDSALNSLTSGSNNTAIGFDALFSNTTGIENTATGASALANNTTAIENTAVGFGALFSTVNGAANTAVGAHALRLNTSGANNTGIGDVALFSNTTGIDNTAIGSAALNQNTSGMFNAANGSAALQSNTTGSNNTGMGFGALFNNTIGAGNSGSGFKALFQNKTGINNTANGRQALQNNTSGSFNVALGNLAGGKLTTGSNNIDIGNQGVAAEAKTIRIGEQGNQQSTFIAGISGVAVTGPAVHVNASGQLGIVPSSAQFKEAIKPMDKTSEAILALQPVTFRYKERLDPDKAPQFGLIAEQVEKVNPDLVVRGAIAELKTTVAQQQKQIEALTSIVQKVSAQIALSKSAPQAVANRK